MRRRISERNFALKISDLIDDVVLFGERYLSLGLEIDATRRMLKGQYSLGATELFIAEFFRAANSLEIDYQRDVLENSI